MDKRAYNRDVKRLGKTVKNLGTSSDTAHWNKVEKEVQTEWLRLYNGDNTFKLASKNSVLTMMRINLRFRFIPLHSFGLFVDI